MLARAFRVEGDFYTSIGVWHTLLHSETYNRNQPTKRGINVAGYLQPVYSPPTSPRYAGRELFLATTYRRMAR